MHKLISIKSSDAEVEIWYIIDSLGNQIGACSSREDASRLAALADYDSSGKASSAEVPTPTMSVKAAAGESAALGPQMFDWYLSHRAISARAFLRRCYMRVLGLR